MTPRNLAASVRARLLQQAQSTQRDFNRILTRYAIERLLYRVSISKYADQFLLKGALLFDLWFDISPRPTKDADFLGLGSAELTLLEGMFKEICSITVPDGVVFAADTVRAVEIREEANYPGVRLTLIAVLDHARSTVQVDVGFGDAVTPAAEMAEYPVLLSDFDAPRLRVYPRYTVVAEKLEILTALGIANSRLKDYFDLNVLAQHTEFDGRILRDAIRATFERRQTTLPGVLPLGLSDVFATDPQKQLQWAGFLNKNKLAFAPLESVVSSVAEFLWPVIDAARDDRPFHRRWSAGGPWR